MRLDWLLLSCLLMASICTASFVHGEIYGPGLEKLNRTVITIDGAFSYQLVTDKGNYSIFLPTGQYTISASSPDGALYASQQVTVGADDQQLDLALKPKDELGILPYLVAIAAIGIVAAVFLWAKARATPKPKPPDSKPAVATPPAHAEPPHFEPVPRPVELDEDAKSVLRALDSFEGRATQKELKETLRFSDAKLSLILTELEQTGRVKRFKRGRANVVRKLK